MSKKNPPSDFNLSHIARLARLHFTPEELRRFESQVAGILSYVEELKPVPVEGIEPTSHPLALANVFREDEVQPSLSIEAFLKTAPSARARFFQVPKVIENQ
jgi:aspartyl-tRNA(Asn)/glutamyl-tRNA(Gln) amidotransferase subunit C